MGVAAYPEVGSRAGRRSLRIRWRIAWMLFGIGFVAYIQRTSLGIAAERMMPELGLSQDQIGWMLTAFMISYTALQFPGGMLGERLGGRRAMAAAGILAFAATLATPLLPLVCGGVALFCVLLATRFLLGAAQAPAFPVESGMIEAWFPAGAWAFPQGLLTCGLGLGSAVTPPLIAELMTSLGWQAALVLTSLPAIGIVVLWWWYARDLPRQHPSVSAAELSELGAGTARSVAAPITLSRILTLLADRNILLLSGAYLMMNYVYYMLTFWCFLYLVQERHFAVLESGWLASVPFVFAALGAAAGGRLSDLICARVGIAKGYRLMPLAVLPTAGLALIAAVEVGNAYVAVAALSVAFALIEMTEGPFWAATMQVAQADTMMATAILNTGGNLGGVIGTPLVAALSGQHHWTAALLTGTGFAFMSGALWFWVDPSRALKTGD